MIWVLFCCVHIDRANAQAAHPSQMEVEAKVLLLKRRLDDSVKVGRFNLVPAFAQEAIRVANGSRSEMLLARIYQHLGDIYDGNQDDSAAKYYRKALDTWKQPSIRKKIYLLQSLIYSYTNQDRKDSIPPYIHALEQTIRTMPDTSRIKLQVINTLATSYEAVNDYVRAVQAFRKVIRLALPLRDSGILANAFVNTGTVYNEIGNDTLAIYYTLEAIPYLSVQNPVLFTAYSNLTNYYAGIGRTEDAWRYLNKAEGLLGANVSIDDSMTLTLHKALILASRQQYDAMEPLLASCLAYYGQQPGSLGLVNTLLTYAQQDTARHNYTRARTRLLQLYEITQTKSAQTYTVATLQLLAMVCSRLGDYQAAYNYQRRYQELNDALKSEQASLNLATLQAEYELYQREERISQLSKATRIQELELQAERRQKIWYIGLAILLAVVFAGAYHLRQQRSQAALQQLRVSLEMKALRSQMNPHFIFNSLNSIQKYIWENKRDDAAEYLTSFARLIRMVLENAQHTSIALSTELSALKLYIDMEHRRSNQQFDYRIHVADNVNTASLQVPPLLLQPYVENAIWHGLSSKEGWGKLTVYVDEQAGSLVYTITDNGIGREAAGRNQKTDIAHKSSLGSNISSQRIDWLRRATGKDASVTITDIYDSVGHPAGTTVTILLPLMYQA